MLRIIADANIDNLLAY